MSLLFAWVYYPLVLALLCGGLGLLVDLVGGRRLPGTLVLPAGLAAMVVVGGFTTATAATAPWTMPLLLALAVAGAGLSLPWRFGRPDPLPAVVALATFLVFAAPVVLSGNPTFTGYIKLDDTATWLAMTDRIMEHGRSLSGLDPSSYRSTLDFNLAAGYPIGAFIPFGAAQKLTGGDLAWLFQPYLSLIAALLPLSLWELLRSFVPRRGARAAAAFVVAQPALLYGYAMWGGVKEVAAASLLTLAAALAPAAVRRGARPRDVLLLAIAAAALVGVLSPGGALWVGPLLAALVVLAYRRFGARGAALRALAFAIAFVVLTLPVLLAGLVPPTSKPLVGSNGEGNLRGPLNLLQVLGIWPNGDFRFDPGLPVPSTVLIGLGVFAAALGLWALWRRRAEGPLLYTSALLTCLVIVVAGSPWAAGKALATASPVALGLAAAGCLAALRLDRVAGIVLAVAVAGGVFWSNALAYHDVSLAPYDQLRELESIGGEFADQGPMLMTEYQPYGVRHFLREADAEGVSELRSRQIPLREGGEAPKGSWVDTDQITLSALLTYRTLVLRRNPAQSRPPSVYSLVRRGEYYDVWERPLASETRLIAEHLPLGEGDEPGAVPTCSEVLEVAAAAGSGGTVAAAATAPNAGAPLVGEPHPTSWTRTESRPELTPGGHGLARVDVDVPRAGRYGVYLLGSTRNRLHAYVEADEVGSVSQQLNNEGQFLYFGDFRLGAGRHEVELELDGQTLAPGSGGPPEPIGPLVLSPVGNQDPRLLEVPAARASTLCGRHLDWLEALPAG